MLLSYKVKGFKVFNEAVELSFKGNKKIKNKDYVFNINNEEILKSAIIYGPNNTGKSCLINSLEVLKAIVLNGQIGDTVFSFDYNLFNEEQEINYEIEFLSKSDKYKYELSFIYKKGITNEVLTVNGELIFDRNKENKVKELNDVVELYSAYKDKLIIATLPKNYMKYTKNTMNFFNKMHIIPKFIDFETLIAEISSLSKNDFNKFITTLKAADISINNISLVDNFSKISENFKLVSEYTMKNKKVSLPSIIGDSDGTHVFMMYIVKIIKMFKEGGILVIDEIDKSLHTLLTKNIISVFNDEKNTNMQLLATSHDLLLLDCLYLFRKDQIWFSYKDDTSVYLYSLNNFKANIDNQIRNKTLESYLKGLFGALPYPNIEEYIFDK